MLVFDCETNGFLDELTTIHCLHMGDPDTGQQWRYSSLPNADGSVEDGVRRLMEEPEIGGHNVHRFDVPALAKVFPWFKPKGYVWDTLALASLAWPKDVLKEKDGKLQKKGKLPGKFFEKGYFAGQQLGAWGYRLGILKGEYEGGWDVFTVEMDDYCAQDVAVTIALWNRIKDMPNGFKENPTAARLENEVLRIIAGQESYGFAFNIEAAHELEATLLARKAELDAQLRAAFKPWWTRDGGPKQSHRVPKRTMRRWEEMGGERVRVTYTAGAPYTKITLKMFNPASRADIANRLQVLYGWKPKVFTESGQPEISEETLDGMEFPEAPLLKEYLMVDKRLGQLSTGKQAWLKHVKPDGRIHGRVNTNQAITGRMTHAFPNVAQVPSVGTPYGAECRSLFYAPDGKLLVGCDAEGLELRCLGHFMARYDGGDYSNSVVNGNKSKGTDVHSVTKNVVGLNLRDSAKTFIYAMIYGGGDPKLGQIVVEDMPEEQRRKWHAQFRTEDAREQAYRKLGSRARARIMKGLPALGKLVDAVQAKVAKVGYLKGIDGRQLPIRKRHAALNTLLQSAGAIVMKQALILAERAFIERGWVIGRDLAFVANIHDEFQIEANEEIAQEVGAIAADAIRRAGEAFGFRCPLAGSADTGRTWADTH